MKKKQKVPFPRTVLKGLAEDISDLVNTSEGCLQVLDIIEEIPFDVRPYVVEGLSSFYWPSMVSFFYLLKLEYGKELQPIVDRALTKFEMAGLDTTCPHFVKGKFLKTYASCTRHTGRMTLDIAWTNENNGVHVESYFLTFRSDGVHSVLVVEDMSVKHFEEDRQGQDDLIELNYQETCLLIQEAYSFNVRYMSRPALGKFLYQKYLDEECLLSHNESRLLMRRLSSRLTPRQLVNVFFHTLKYQDFNYLLSIISESRFSESLIFFQLNNVINPGALLLEAKVEEGRGSQDKTILNAYSLNLHDREVTRNDYVFTLVKEDNGLWVVAAIERVSSMLLEEDDALNPFSMQVFSRVYEIMDMDVLFDTLDQVENIREVEELPYGLHMRVSCLDEDFDHGVSFMKGVTADMVINGDEFVIITQDAMAAQEYDDLFFSEGQNPLVFLGEYQVSLTAAYSYLSGQYVEFEDILLEDADDMIFEDGLRCITARYVVKDREMVLERLEELGSIQVDFPGTFQVFYQMEEEKEHSGFMAEYILGPNWITVSAFGERDIGRIRQRFEDNMYEALEFDGLEIREEGIFDILTEDVKKQYPGLEAELKEMYLNKWYYSQLPTLHGMSPSEACKTEEGARLLWAMFKKIRQKEKIGVSQGQIKQIGLKEYIRRVDRE